MTNGFTRFGNMDAQCRSFAEELESDRVSRFRSCARVIRMLMIIHWLAPTCPEGAG